MQTFYLTDAGKVRSHNEDSVTIINNKNNMYRDKRHMLKNKNKYILEKDYLKERFKK